MAIVKQQTPYEFLVRWDNGVVVGAHIRFLERLVEDGTVISEKEGHAKPVSLAGEAGFPIAGILSLVQANALADLATAQAALAVSEAKVAALQAQLGLPAEPQDPREVAKAAREKAVSEIKVTTQAGNTFDGDEISQGRMSRAIIALSTGLAPSVNWVLADNSVIQATAAELTEALVMAGQAQAAIWVIA